MNGEEMAMGEKPRGHQVPSSVGVSPSFTGYLTDAFARAHNNAYNFCDDVLYVLHICIAISESTDPFLPDFLLSRRLSRPKRPWHDLRIRHKLLGAAEPTLLTLLHHVAQGWVRTLRMGENPLPRTVIRPYTGDDRGASGDGGNDHRGPLRLRLLSRDRG